MELYTAAGAGRLEPSSTSWERIVNTGHSGDRNKERQRAGREVLLCSAIYNTEMCRRYERNYAPFSQCMLYACFQLTAFVYVRRDVDGGGVIRDEPFEVGVCLEIVWNISVLIP